MINRLSMLAVSVLVSQSVNAEYKNNLEETLVYGLSTSLESSEIYVDESVVLDTADALAFIPGASANKNGPLSGIAQYRGLFGDRIAVTLDGAEVLSGGPNAMDAPLSYASPLITESLTVERGIVSVSKASESFGGHVDARLARGEFTTEEAFELSGFGALRYNANANARSSALRVTGANNSHKLSLLAALDRGDDYSSPLGDILPTEHSRDRLDLSYGFRNEERDALIYVGLLDTQDSGTPALAMDIRSIETDMFGGHYKSSVTDKLDWRIQVNYSDVVHWMDNFSLRPAPANPMMARQNYATADGLGIKLGADYDLGFARMDFGVDSKSSEHSSTITNPNAEAFEVENFNGITRDQWGVFAQLHDERKASFRWELGLRYNSVSTDAGEVSSAGMMGMMGQNAATLATAFNSAERAKDFNNVDVVAKYGRTLTAGSRFLIEAGSKARAPSHQELYLWLPLQATGGLADGRNYIGNTELDAERVNEVNLGFEFSNSRGRLAPQIFIKKIDDYIQGTQTTNMVANMVATMMSGSPALQFNNVDAEISGLDTAWNYAVNDALHFEGVITLIAGERTDVDDNLYRQSPNNARVAVHYRVNADLRFGLESQLYDKQRDVAEFNGEQPSAGYGLVNLYAAWQPVDELRLDLRVDNAGDKAYQNHLAGVNRVMMSSIPVGERLYGAERSVSAAVKYQF